MHNRLYKDYLLFVKTLERFLNYLLLTFLREKNLIIIKSYYAKIAV